MSIMFYLFAFCIGSYVDDATDQKYPPARELVFQSLLRYPELCEIAARLELVGWGTESKVYSAICELSDNKKDALGKVLVRAYERDFKTSILYDWVLATQSTSAIVKFTIDMLVPWNSIEKRIFAIDSLCNMGYASWTAPLFFLLLRDNDKLWIEALSGITWTSSQRTVITAIFLIYLDHNPERSLGYFELIELTAYMPIGYDLLLLPLLCSDPFHRKEVVKLLKSKGDVYNVCITGLVLTVIDQLKAIP